MQQRRYAAKGCVEFIKENDIEDIPDVVLRNLKKHVGGPVPIESVEHAVKILNIFYERYQKLDQESDE